jgi:5-methylcytosine-specific restriction endonuclease McrA
MRLCPYCRGEVARGQRCRCRTTTARGYGHAWQQHSKARRSEDDHCTDCGATDDLTVDHPTDDVVCRACNSARGHTTHA